VPFGSPADQQRIRMFDMLTLLQTTSPPLVSIIIPCFARSQHDFDLLIETLGTVSSQTCQDFEAIVVDDGSPYDVSAVANADSKVRVIRRANGGSAMARNTGIQAAAGRYFVFLDADDHLLPDGLEVGLRHLEEHPSCGWTIGPREEMTFEGSPVPWNVAPPPSGTDIYLPLLRFSWYIIPPSAAMFRRDVVEQLGGFRDPWGADDLDFYLRAARISPAWCYGSPAVTRYRRYSASSSRDGERMLRSIRTVYDRQWRNVAGHPEGELAFHAGLSQLTEIFRDCLIENIEDAWRMRRWRCAVRATALLARESPRRLGSVIHRVVK
jgi:glycosyltransferase involved in cell wall biosynthesis